MKELEEKRKELSYENIDLKKQALTAYRTEIDIKQQLTDKLKQFEELEL